jgi:hypothetical protein
MWVRVFGGRPGLGTEVGEHWREDLIAQCQLRGDGAGGGSGTR